MEVYAKQPLPDSCSVLVAQGMALAEETNASWLIPFCSSTPATLSSRVEFPQKAEKLRLPHPTAMYPQRSFLFP